MEFLKKYGISSRVVGKMALLFLGGVFVLAFLMQLFGFPSQALRAKHGGSVFSEPAIGIVEHDLYAEEFGLAAGDSVAGLSRIAPGVPGSTIPEPIFTSGSDAEDFEVTQYSAMIETNDLAGTCDAILQLKAREEVIFEHAIEYDHGCDYTFKVANEQADEVFAVLAAMDPKELTEHTQTIKRQVENITNETEILKEKLASIDATLATATAAYDEITSLAVDTRDAASLARIIDNKIAAIERLNQSRISIATQLGRLERSRADQLDRLEYTLFTVAVSENVFVDGDQLSDSWKAAIRVFVRNLNLTVQNVTINFITFLLSLLQFVLYAVVLVVIAKYGWRLGKRFWKA